MYDLNGKVALVTGTSSRKGLGCGIALRLAREGADLVVNDKYKDPKDIDAWDKEVGWRGLESTVAEIETLGRRALAVTADVSNSREVNDMVEKAVEEFGRIDILVNNAGIVSRDIGAIPVVDLSEEAWNKAIMVNLTGVFLVCKAVAKQMIKQGQGGKIVNVSSVFAKRPLPTQPAYGASKLGQIYLTQSLALDLAPHKINVNAICPGVIVTWGSMGKRIYEAVKQGLSEEEAIIKVHAESGVLQQIPLGRVATVEDVTNLVAFLASTQSDYITGEAIDITGGWLM